MKKMKERSPIEGIGDQTYEKNEGTVVNRGSVYHQDDQYLYQADEMMIVTITHEADVRMQSYQ